MTIIIIHLLSMFSLYALHTKITYYKTIQYNMATMHIYSGRYTNTSDILCTWYKIRSITTQFHG